MPEKSPILFIGYSRFDYIRESLNNIINDNDRSIYISIDGANFFTLEEQENRNRFINEIYTLENEKVTAFIESQNLGLRKNVITSVNRVLRIHDRIIVCEDDVVIDKFGLEIFDYLLSAYEKSTVAHVSIYNRVPTTNITDLNFDFRFSYIPETYVWGTWKDRWCDYRDNFEDLNEIGIDLIKNKVGTWIGALVWKIHIWEAKVGIVDSWAYRWLCSLWINNYICITTNKNYVEYHGARSGTHTSIFFQKNQLPVSTNFSRVLPNRVDVDGKAEKWTLRQDANGTIFRLIIKLLQTLGAIFRKIFRKFKIIIKIQKKHNDLN